MAPIVLKHSNAPRECRKAQGDFNWANFRESCALSTGPSKNIQIAIRSRLELGATRETRAPPAARPIPWAQPSRRESERRAGIFVMDLEVERASPGRSIANETEMANVTQKIALCASRDIPFNKLILSQSNVRRHGTVGNNRPEKDAVSIEELAENIFRRTLLQDLSVRAVFNAEGEETSMFEVPAGGRRFRALELLAKQKRMAKTHAAHRRPRRRGLARRKFLSRVASSARPVQGVSNAPRQGLERRRHRRSLFVSPAIVKQRLRLAAVSPRLFDVYGEDAMRLEQLMAFTVSADHRRQEQVWESLARSYSKEPYTIRRLLTEGAVRAGDKRAQFVGIAAYEAAGGVVMRDLFAGDNAGWLQDPALLDRLAREKLKSEAEVLRAEGWK